MQQLGHAHLHRLNKCEEDATTLNTATERHLKTNKQMNLPFEKRQIGTLKSGLGRLKDHHMERSRFSKVIQN